MTSEFTKNTIEAAIRLGLLFLLASWCLKIVYPFIVPTMWGVIIAVAVYPLFRRLEALLGGHTKLAAVVYTLIALAILVTPTVMVSGSLIETAQVLTEKFEQGQLKLPPPNEQIKNWPLIGDDIHSFWAQASANLEATLNRYQEQVKQVGEFVISAAAGAGGGILQFVLSIIISGFLVAHAEGAYQACIKFFARVINPEKGVAFTNLTRDTIRSVAQGVLGVAIIQAILSAIGMMLMDVPGWGLWTLLILVLAVAQLPPILVLGFVIAYVFSTAATTPAVIFTIYSLIVSASDGFLKPLLLGRGMETPTLIILIGAIGGMIASGIIGLFVGAIVLALGYELFMAWLHEDDADTANAT